VGIQADRLYRQSGYVSVEGSRRRTATVGQAKRQPQRDPTRAVVEEPNWAQPLLAACEQRRGCPTPS